QVSDAVLADEFTAHQPEQHDTEHEIRAEDDEADLREERGLLRIDHHDREGARGQEHPAECDDLLRARERLEGDRPPLGWRSRKRERLHRVNRSVGRGTVQQLTCHVPRYGPDGCRTKRLAASHDAEEWHAHLTRWAGGLQVAVPSR